MRKIIVLFIALFILAEIPVSAQWIQGVPSDTKTTSAEIDVVYLKNGDVVKGIIIENTPDLDLKIRIADGTVVSIPQIDIGKITKETETKQIIFKSKSPGTAWVCSFFLPGGGQFYNGQIVKGVVSTGLWLGSLGLAMSTTNEDLNSFCALVFLSNYLWSMIDAPISAIRINKKISNDMMSFKVGKNSTLSIKPCIIFANPSDIDSYSGVYCYSGGVKLTLDW